MWFGQTAALGAALLLQALPVYFGAGLIATMDSALVFFWMVGLVGVSVALRRGRAWGWYLAGFGLGGAMLSKYTGVFLGVGALLVVVGHQPWRRHLRTVHPYAAAILALAIFTPVLVWNAQNDWASFRFQFTDRFGEKALNFGSIASFAGLQLAVATPVILGALGWFYLRMIRNRRRLLTARWLIAVCFSLPLLLVMSYKSLRYTIHLNWTMPLYLSVFPAVIRLGLAQWRRVRGKTVTAIRWHRTALATSAVCVSVNMMASVYALALQPRTGWVSAIGPWPELAAVVEAVEDQVEAQTGKEPLIIAGGKYRLASVLAFYRTPLEKKVRASDFTTSQWLTGGVGLGYPYWSPEDHWQNLPCVVVDDNNGIEKFAARFERFDIVADFQPIGKKAYHIAIGRGRRE
jgi:dolichol-phosphate mannosyltransferase